MNQINEKRHLTLQEAIQKPDFENVGRPLKPHPNPCTIPRCFYHVLMADVPSVFEERWRVVQRGERWIARYEPLNHPKRWRDLASFGTREEAMEYLRSY